MSITDWTVLSATLLFIILYGVYKSRGTKNISGYLLADKKLPWYHVGLSVMATQASAITFLSAPGQGYADGMRFVQFYFGLPLAMVVLCITFVPIFHKLKVFTAYEYLQHRFDLRTRTFTAALFLLQRGLSTGITIYAPAIILSTILEIDIFYTILLNGLLVIFYTVYGGTRAVSYTQVFQMSVIFGGLILAAWLLVIMLPEQVSLYDAMHIAGKMNRLNAIETSFDLEDRYTLWSGLIGGFFLQLSYFGTDQSQVGRYLTGSSVSQSRLGLIMNGLVKIPMQFFILLIGVMVFTFYQFHQPPIFFNKVELNKLENSALKKEYQSLERRHQRLFTEKNEEVEKLVGHIHQKNNAGIDDSRRKLLESEKEIQLVRTELGALMKQNDPRADTNDGNYVFLSFVTQYMPKGVVGLLIAIIFLAAMGSTASGMNSLASTTVVDFYKVYVSEKTDEHYLSVSRWSTVIWGLFCIVVAFYAARLGNLIEAVNILGSLFYGTILGIFLVAFYLKKVQSGPVFTAAVITQIFVAYAWLVNLTAFLWLNVIGCLMLMVLALIFQKFIDRRSRGDSVRL